MNLQLPFRDNYGLMPSGTDLAIFVVLAPFISVFIYGVYLRIRSYGGISAVKSFLSLRMFDHSSFLRNVLLQSKMIKELFSGVMHIAVMYGTIVLFIGTLLIFIDHDILRFFSIKILMGDFYLLYEALLDLFGLLFVAGLIMAINRRVGTTRLKRLGKKNEYMAILAGLLFIGLTGFALEGLRLSLVQVYWSKYSFIGWLISEFIRLSGAERSLLQIIYQSIWWVHALAAFSLIAAMPYTSMAHYFLAALNASVRRAKEPSIYTPATPFRLTELYDSPNIEVKIGFRNINELNTIQKIAIDACTDCGRCEEACPATASGTPLSPRNIIQKLRLELRHSSTKNVFDVGILTVEEVYACTTCGACVYACPALINPLEYIMEARRTVALEGKLEKHVIRMLTNLSRTKNPFGFTRAYKESAINELKSIGAKTLDEYPEAEYVYWLGCMALYDERTRKVAKSLVKIMIKCGVSFAILGTEEVCTGDPARRVGEEGRYQELAYHNIELLRRHADKIIITHCPHCYNIFKNEYRDLGLRLKVIHHTELLDMLVRSGKLKLAVPAKLTLHDSCYLSRFNKILEEPRNALSGNNLIEMKRHGRDTFCCGGGGGNYWYEVKRVKRENLLRIEEAIQTGADVLVVECPFCLAMLEDANRIVGNKIKVLDIAEVFEVE